MNFNNKRILIAELTAPVNLNLNERETTKETKYHDNLISIIEQKGWKGEFVHLGIGALGTTVKKRRVFLSCKVWV